MDKAVLPNGAGLGLGDRGGYSGDEKESEL